MFTNVLWGRAPRSDRRARRASFVPTILEDRILLSLFSAVRSGDWSDETVWGRAAGSGEIPRAGDVVTIGSGRTVVVSRDAEVGNSPAPGTNVLTVQGRLNIDPNVVLTVRGDVLQSGLVGSDGQIWCAGSFVVDGRAASARYKIACGAEHNTTAKLVFNGTEANRASFASLGTGTTNAFVANGRTYIGAGRIEASYTDFARIGDAAENLTWVWLVNAASSALRLDHCAFVGCGKLTTTVNPPPASGVSLLDNVWIDSASGFNVVVNGSGAVATGPREILNNRFDKTVQLTQVNGFRVEDNLLGGGYVLTGFAPASWTHNLVDTTNPQGLAGVTNAKDNYYFDDTGYNPHTFLTGAALDYVVDGLIFDAPQGQVGDLIVGGPGPGHTLSMVVRNNVVLPNSAGGSPGKFVNGSDPSFTYTIEHNTVTSTSAQGSNAETGVAAYGETYAGRSGMFASIRSNLVHSPTGKGAFLLRHVLGQVSDPLVSPEMGDYNGGNAPVAAAGSGVLSVYGPAGGYADVAGAQTAPPTPMFTSTAGLGAQDVVGSPNFVDFTRNVATFDSAYLGRSAPAWTAGRGYAVGDVVSASSAGFYGGATVNFRCVSPHTSDAASALTGRPGAAANWRGVWEFASLRTIGESAEVYDPAVRKATPRDLYEWVRAGAAPTNPVFRGAAHDGGDVGAVPVSLAPVASSASARTGQDTPVPITLAATDPNGSGAPLTYSVTAAPAHGSLAGVAPNLVYTPDPGHFGADSFVFAATNSQGQTGSATIFVEVVGRPTATGGSLTVGQGGSVGAALTAGDPNTPPLPLTYAITVAPAHGSLSGAAPNLVYTPEPSYFGPDSFRFVVDNGVLASFEALVSIDVVGRPTAVSTSLSVDQGGSVAAPLSASDPNTPPLPLSYTITAAPAHGTLSGTAPNLTYTPAAGYSGPDFFRFKAGNGFLDGAEATVSIDVIPASVPVVTDLRVRYGGRWTSVLGLNRVLPWINIDAVAYEFSADVVAAKANLRIGGINVATYSTSTFQYDPATRTAVWGLPSALGVDVLTMTLDGTSESAVRSPLGPMLGGGADFVATLRILPGDVNGDGIVDTKDQKRVKSVIAGEIPPSAYDDVDGDGLVNNVDFEAVKIRNRKKLP